jgi:COMPASS component BRE2
VSSPLNPDFAAARARKPAPAREQREKKETLKKREAKGVESARSGTPDAQAAAQTRRAKKGPDHGAAGAAAAAAPAPVLINFPLPPPKATDFDPPRPPVLVPVLEKCGRRFYEATEQ